MILILRYDDKKGDISFAFDAPCRHLPLNPIVISFLIYLFDFSSCYIAFLLVYTLYRSSM